MTPNATHRDAAGSRRTLPPGFDRLRLRADLPDGHVPTPGLGQSTGYDYSRSANPTRTALETTIAELEGGARGLAFASGMAAVTAVAMLFRPGDHLVVSDDLYGGTYRLFQQILGPQRDRVHLRRYVGCGSGPAALSDHRPGRSSSRRRPTQ